jgi:hypothetical protein
MPEDVGGFRKISEKFGEIQKISEKFGVLRMISEDLRKPLVKQQKL